jgi:D-alanine-D-alanine ligase
MSRPHRSLCPALNRSGERLVTPTAARALRVGPTADAPAVLGPVADLERHLPKEWWRDLFGELYLRTDGDVVENGAATSAEVDAVVAVAGLRPEHRVLDLCCGQGRHALELARRGFTAVTGVDQSAHLIGLTRQRAQEAALAVQFRHEDARHPDAPHAYDRVLILGNSFGYFEAAEEDVALLE